MDEYNRVGVKSSDIYYKHHDNMEMKKQALKGGAHDYAQMLKD